MLCTVVSSGCSEYGHREGLRVIDMNMLQFQRNGLGEQDTEIR